MDSKTSILLTGVGGQGVITAANILGMVAVRSNINVYVSEIHGLSQRGGSVNCSVRMGNVSSPMITNGTADVILSLEPIEALRNIFYVNKETKVITDINPIIPFTVTTRGEEYPRLDDVFKEIKSRADLYKIDALCMAKESGSVKSKNIVMLGLLSATDVLPFSSDIILETILDNATSSYQDINKKAFESGVKSMKNLRAVSNLLK
jgi:indolepyruvate ferredoxin oxidoreductase beta subunit